MEKVLRKRASADMRQVALKAVAAITDAWSLTVKEAAGLVDMSESTWKRARQPGFSGDLTHDQMLRLSAIVGLYKGLELYFGPQIARRWVKLPNEGPEFAGQRPLDAMTGGGLPKIIRVRTYVDALRGGA
ncbi:MbcA/ParS/Xre antitoxin family protein [Acuticoccus kandeliae]|uniref:MbcA/ParS/Xre antitoxin family protein n=1 Tax=Acuticoccus kandeliae TaxID=2073160 RepID=UPI000D3E1491|nr:MbcA/ParS/Xre antitoxin family protein [Acuticoccus kandeliae]